MLLRGWNTIVQVIEEHSYHVASQINALKPFLPTQHELIVFAMYHDMPVEFWLALRSPQPL